MTLIQLYDKGLTPFQQLLGYNKGNSVALAELGRYSKRRASIRFIKRRGSKTLAQKMAVSIVRQKASLIPRTMMRKRQYAQVLRKHS